MMEEVNILKHLLNYEFWENNKHRIPSSAFTEDCKSIYRIIEACHKKYRRTLHVQEVQAVFKSINPTISVAKLTQINSVLAAIEKADRLGEDVAQDVLEEMWRTEVGRQVTEVGIALTEGTEKTLDSLARIMETHSTAFIPKDFVDETPKDVVELLSLLSARSCWKFNLSALSSRIPGISPGEFMVVLARPDTGKTAFIINMIAGPNGFAQQGAKVHLIGNEEPLVRSMARAISCYTGMTFDQIQARPQDAQAKFYQVSHNITMVDDVSMTLHKLEAYIKINKPDIVIIDQLDRLTPSGSFESGHEKLTEIYSRARELAKLYNCVVIGVTQASAEAEGKTRVTYSMADGSKTGKAAAADLILGIGMAPQQEGVDSDTGLRYITASKNKLSGWKGTIACKLVAEISRYVD